MNIFRRNFLEKATSSSKYYIRKEILDNLSAQAKANPRFRQSFDLCISPNDQFQRMLNALEPGTIMLIYRHKNTSNTMVIVRGSLIEYFYDDLGNLVHEILMMSNSEHLIIQIKLEQWHSFKYSEEGTIIFEQKMALMSRIT